jgi:hypothetical protein
VTGPVCPDIDPHAAWQVRDLRDRVGTATVRAYLDYLDAVAETRRCEALQGVHAADCALWTDASARCDCRPEGEQ